MDKEIIKDIILKEIPGASCQFEGDSCNFKLIVSSPKFEGMTLINQHKAVLGPLKEKFESGVLHALSLETKIG